MKVSVIGAGAIGSMFGGLLKHHAPDVDLAMVTRGSHGRAMRQEGCVSLIGPWGTCRVGLPLVSEDAEDIAGSDFVIFSVKSQASEEAIRQAAPFLGDATVVSIQNGINQRVLKRFVDPDRLIMAMTTTNMTVVSPGTVSLQRHGPTLIGANGAGNASAQVAGAAEMLERTNLPIVACDDILGAQYNKLALNTLGYASVLSNSNVVTEAILNRPWRRYVGLPLLRESLSVIAGSGIAIADTPGSVDAKRLCRRLSLLGIPPVNEIVKLLARRGATRRPVVYSVYQDLIRGKKTEIEFVNGEIVRLAEQHKIKAPRNAKVVEMVHELERRGEGTFFSRDEVIETFRRIGEGPNQISEEPA